MAPRCWRGFRISSRTRSGGYSVDNLEAFRQFYLDYPRLISETMPRNLELPGISETLSRKSAAGPGEPGSLHPGLSWSHYRCLLRIGRQTARDFYEIEAIRDPVVMEFLGLPESPRLVESKLEQALIDNLQHFLLELGKGFAFLSRQERITLDGDHFYIDLVFYHAVLKCYVLIDLKVGKLTHADLGQIQFYVNYYDRERRTPGDNPTLGLILCPDKNDAMVKYTLGEQQERNIFATRYQLHLPTEEELQRELRRELRQLTSAERKPPTKKSAGK